MSEATNSTPSTSGQTLTSFHDLRPGDIVLAHGTRMEVLSVRRENIGGVVGERTLVTWQEMASSYGENVDGTPAPHTYRAAWNAGLALHCRRDLYVEHEPWCLAAHTLDQADATRLGTEELTCERPEGHGGMHAAPGGTW